MGSLLREISVALRQLGKTPAFTATAVIMLALGIGATTAIFSIVEGVLLRSLPFPEPERLVALGDILQGATGSSEGTSIGGVTAPDVRNYRRDTHVFVSLGGYRQEQLELSGSGEPAMVRIGRFSGGVFESLGVAPLLGRTFTDAEDNSHQPVAVLSYGMWQERFSGESAIVGKKILLDRKPYLVIGVMPSGFEFPLVPGHLQQSQLWVPVSFEAEDFKSGASNWQYAMMGRLKRGVTAAEAQADANRVAEQTMRDYPGYMRNLRISAAVTPLRQDAVQGARPVLMALFLAVCVVLLIASTNLAGLLLVRAIRRRKEIAIRVALGASTGTLIRATTLESLLLSTTGAALGLFLATIVLRAGVNLLPETLPRVHEIGLNWTVGCFALLLAVVTGVLCGLAPAFAAMRTSLNDVLKEGGRTGAASGAAHSRLRAALVIGEIAIAMVLLAASGLLLRSYQKMREVDLGFRPEQTISARYSLPKQQYSTQSSINEFTDILLRRLQALPGTKSVGLTSRLPSLDVHSNSAFVVEGYVPPPGKGLTLGMPSLVEGDAFRALGISLLQGRFFTPEDKVGAQMVVIVNKKLADHYWPGQSALGKRLRMGLLETETPWLTIVGVVGNVKLGAPDEVFTEQMYEPATQALGAYGVLANPKDLVADLGYVVLRSDLPSAAAVSGLRDTVRSIDPRLALTSVYPMEDNVLASEAPRKFNTVLISSFAAVAVLLASLGIYSVIAFSVALQADEIAIRMALGSSRARVVSMVLRSGVKLATTGCAVGVIGATAVSQLLKSFLFEMTAFDPLVLAAAAGAILVLSLLACLLPARRAASVDPNQALRSA